MRFDPAPAAPYALVVIAAAAAALPALPAYAVDYLTIADSQKLMFPAATSFVAQPLNLSPEQWRRIDEHGVKPAWTVWQARQGDKVLGWVVADAVIGKMELIHYAVALDASGTIGDVQILSYRESHGGEVRNAAWRAQFNGKNAASPLQLGDDIRVISGATLSCRHLTDGIRRIAALAKVGLPAVR